MAKTLVLILGDQLTPDIAALRGCDPAKTIVLMAEVADEASYVRHHVKKLVFVFSAMRHFADELRALGWTVDYVQLDDPGNSGSLKGEVARALARHNACHVRLTEPGEWRLAQDVQRWSPQPELCADDRFVCSPAEFAAWAEGRKTLRMEFFYREMRRRTGLLMAGDAPEGGCWNFDSENRKRAAPDLLMPQPLRVAPDAITQAVITMVAARFADHFGTIEPFHFPVTRADAEAAAEQFMVEALPQFGDYQDAMLRGAPFLYHSLLSPLINVGLLDPLALCRRAERAWHEGAAPLNAVEGYIRQIIGWREYVRGIYWREGPDYMTRNALGATRRLPAFYWTAQTDMACMAAAIGQTRDEAYAHHIQRLMVTGNFALLAGIDPHEVHLWYLAVYIDAYEWVEAPNTIGMSQFADGGIIASKPYVSSGAYIDRMSDYCGSCRFSVKQKTGPDACPFNALYWHFLMRHRARFAHNPRMAQMYRSFERMDAGHQAALLAQAERFLEQLDGAAAE